MNGSALPLRLLAVATFLSSSGARVIDPLLHPVAVDFGVTVPQVSIVIAAFTLPYGLNQLVLGPVGDRFGKLRVILGALCFYALFTGGCAFATGLQGLAGMRVLAGAASAGLIPLTLAYIGDAVPYADRQVTLSKVLTGSVLASVLAGPVGGMFGEFVGWRGVFLVLAGMATVLAGALAMRIRGLPDRRSPGAMLKPENYVAILRHRPGRLILLGSALDGVFYMGCFPFLAPYMHERFGLNYFEVGLILSCFGVGSLVYVRYARQVLNALGEGGMVLAGGAMMATATLAAVAAPQWWMLVPMEFALGLGFFMLHNVLQAQATEILPEARATSVAMFACLLFLGQAAGAPLIGGAIAQFGYRCALVLDSAAMIALAVWLWFVLRQPVVPHADDAGTEPR